MFCDFYVCIIDVFSRFYLTLFCFIIFILFFLLELLLLLLLLLTLPLHSFPFLLLFLLFVVPSFSVVVVYIYFAFVDCLLVLWGKYCVVLLGFCSTVSFSPTLATRIGGVATLLC